MAAQDDLIAGDRVRLGNANGTCEGWIPDAKDLDARVPLIRWDSSGRVAVCRSQDLRREPRHQLSLLELCSMTDVKLPVPTGECDSPIGTRYVPQPEKQETLS